MLQVDALIDDDFIVEAELGEGDVGRVVLARALRTGTHYAVKTARASNKSVRRNLLRELEAWLSLPACEYVVDCRFLRSRGDDILIFSEFVHGGSIETQVQSGSLYDDPTKLSRLALHAARGLSWIHRNALLHRDIKPANLFFGSVGKIGDFGVSAFDPEHSERELVIDFLVQDVGSGAARTAMKQLLARQLSEGEAAPTAGSSKRFTLEFASPDQLNGKLLSPQSDIWSLGLAILYALNGALTWDSGDLANDVLSDLVTHGPHRSENASVVEALFPLLRRCFASTAGNQWSSAQDLADAIEHAFAIPKAAREPEETTQLISVRRLPDGSEWNDPRSWLHLAFESAGLPIEDAREFWPIYEGSRSAQLVSDLRAMEEAERVLSRSASTHADSHTNHANLLSQIALVHRALGDRIACVTNFERAADVSALVEDDALASYVHLSFANALRNYGLLSRAQLQSELALSHAEAIPESSERSPLGAALQAHANVLFSVGHSGYIEAVDRAIAAYEKEGSHVGVVSALALKVSFLRRTSPALVGAVEQRLTHIFETSGTSDFSVNCNYARYLHDAFTSAASSEDVVPLADQAVSLYEELIKFGDTQLQRELAHLLFARGYALETIGRPVSALDDYLRAIRLWKHIVDDQGEFSDTETLAKALTFAANIQREFGQFIEAETTANKSIEIWRALGAVDRSARENLAHARSTLAACASAAGDHERAYQLMVEAMNDAE